MFLVTNLTRNRTIGCNPNIYVCTKALKYKLAFFFYYLTIDPNRPWNMRAEMSFEPNRSMKPGIYQSSCSNQA